MSLDFKYSSTKIDCLFLPAFSCHSRRKICGLYNFCFQCDDIATIFFDSFSADFWNQFQYLFTYYNFNFAFSMLNSSGLFTYWGDLANENCEFWLSSDEMTFSITFFLSIHFFDNEKEMKQNIKIFIFSDQNIQNPNISQHETLITVEVEREKGWHISSQLTERDKMNFICALLHISNWSRDFLCIEQGHASDKRYERTGNCGWLIYRNNISSKRIRKMLLSNIFNVVIQSVVWRRIAKKKISTTHTTRNS